MESEVENTFIKQMYSIFTKKDIKSASTVSSLCLVSVKNNLSDPYFSQ